MKILLLILLIISGALLFVGSQGHTAAYSAAGICLFSTLMLALSMFRPKD